MNRQRELKAFLASYKQFPAADAMQDSALMECAEALAALEAENAALKAWKQDAVEAMLNFRYDDMVRLVMAELKKEEAG